MGSTGNETECIDPDNNYMFLGLTESGKGYSEFPKVLSILSLSLERTVKKNGRLLDSTEKDLITIFHGHKVPDLGVQRYIQRIFKYSKCSPSCFILAQIYMDRYLQKTGVSLIDLNIHRLIITSVVIAAKFIDDAFFNNAYYARVGGVSTQEMNKLEMNLLLSLDFRLQVNIGTFQKYCFQLEKEATVYHVERQPQVVCRQEEWTKKIEESKCQQTLQRCSCGAV